MALFGVRVNGVPQWTGATVQAVGGVAVGSSAQAVAVYNVGNSTTTTTYERVGLDWAANTAVVGVEKGSAGTARSLRVQAAGAGGAVIFATNGTDNWAVVSGGELQPQSSGTYDIGDSTNAIRDLHINRYVNFTPAASTFAQTATITNGPRAANPVAWVEVKVAGSTGRIPVW